MECGETDLCEEGAGVLRTLVGPGLQESGLETVGTGDGAHGLLLQRLVEGCEQRVDAFHQLQEERLAEAELRHNDLHAQHKSPRVELQQRLVLVCEKPSAPIRQRQPPHINAMCMEQITEFEREMVLVLSRRMAFFQNWRTVRWRIWCMMRTISREKNPSGMNGKRKNRSRSH